MNAPRALVWSWADAARGAVFALPAAAVGWYEPAAGVPLALGVLPAAILPFPPVRRARVALLVVGAVTGLSLVAGAVLGRLPAVVSALALATVVVLAAVATTRRPAATLLLVLGAPMVAAGLSYDIRSAAQVLVLMVGAAAYAFGVSLLWPPGSPRYAGASPDRRAPDARAMVGYGLRLGTAAALAYLIAVAVHLDHAGWAPAACLLAARPSEELLRRRGLGRPVSVLVGALVGLGTVASGLPPPGLAVLLVAAVAGAAATRASRWYVTPAFSTFLVILLLVLGHPEDGARAFDERVGATVLGTGLALAFGWVLPSATRRRTRAPHGDEAGADGSEVADGEEPRSVQ